MMLEKIVIKNILGHKNTTIDLVPGVNVFTGISEAGKSSVLDAVYWVLYNRPSADGLRSHWDNDSSSVELHFTDGVVTRYKSKTENIYILNDEKMLAGRNVPEPVQEFLNCSDINFQGQFTPAFMLDWTPPERGAFLNKITNLQIIDSTISNIKKTIRTENSLISSYELQLTEYKAQVKEYRGLDEFEEAVLALEEKQAEIKRYKAKNENLNELFERITELDDAIEQNNSKLKLKNQIQEMNDTFKNLLIYQEKRAVLLQLRGGIGQCNNGIEKQKKIVKDSTAEFKKLMPKTCPLCNK